MVGDIVIVRQFGGVPVVRRVLDQDDKAVYITSDEQLRLLSEGARDILSIGIPRKDVFKYDAAIANNMDILFGSGDWDWNKLELWR